MEFNAIELEILWKRLISVVDEAAAAFVRTCFSTLVRDGNDFAIVLTDAQGRSLAQSAMSLPGFIGCLPATVRHAIAKIPDGVYRSTLQHDGFESPIVIQCQLTVKGDRIDIDYAGSSPQVARALNVVPIYTFAYTVYGLKALLCPEIPNNEGSFLP